MTTPADTLDDLFREHSPALTGLGIEAAVIPALRALLDDVKDANTRLNLVADASPHELFFAHLIDSLQALRDPAAARPAAKIIDVGAGGGFPGLPLLIARPAWAGTLIDGVRKKMDAVGLLAEKHARTRAAALWGRAEDLARDPKHRESYDLAFCRAVGRFTEIAELTLPFLRVGGSLLAHRGHEALDEVKAAGAALDRLGGAPGTLTAYDLPGRDKKRYIVRVDKIRPTPAEFPRRAGMPAKRPL